MMNARFLRHLSFVVFTVVALGCGLASPASAQEQALGSQNDTGLTETYRLGSGDRLRVSVFGEADLTGEYVVDGAGFVNLPLVGQVQAGGETVLEFEREVTTRYANGFLLSPRVSAEVVNYRPFYILGEVSTPGEYDYVDGMSVLNAVALAGGFTYRAQQRQVYVRRDGSDEEITLSADQLTKIYPGDIIRVGERFF
jgi:protein involved in polysaccharide export with SLBB domain